MDSPSSINVHITRALEGVHQSAWHTHVWFHLRSGRIVIATLDSQLSNNLLLFNQVPLYLVSVTWIYMFFYQTFCVPRVFLWSASQQFQTTLLSEKDQGLFVSLLGQVSAENLKKKSFFQISSTLSFIYI